MRRFIVLALALFVLFSLVISAWVYEGNTGDLLAKYQRLAPFSAREMTYQSAHRAFLGNGVILYQPAFPNLPLKVKADKVSLKMKGAEMILHFFGVEIDVAETLRQRDGQNLMASFRQFNVPDDFFLKPLETMALLYKDVVKGNVELRLRPQGKNTALTIQLEQNGRPVFKMDTVIWNVPDNRLWGWIEGTIQSAEIQIMNRSLLGAVESYYKGIQRPVPASVKEAMDTNRAMHIQLNLPQSWPVQNLLYRF